MGMAAGQARLLSITSRMSDNELRAQIINNNKMRLATQSSQASEAYVTALNEAQMMFTNYDKDNNTSYQRLTYNALTDYNPYNNQYIVTNASGNVLLSEKDAINYKNANGDVNKFLEAYGLKNTTTYFDNLVAHAGNIELTDGSNKFGIKYKTGLINPITGKEVDGVISDPKGSTDAKVIAKYIQDLYEGNLTDKYGTPAIQLHPGYDNAIASDDYYNYNKLLGDYTLKKDAYLETIAQLMSEKLEAMQANGKNLTSLIAEIDSVADMRSMETLIGNVETIVEAAKDYKIDSEASNNYFDNLKSLLTNNKGEIATLIFNKNTAATLKRDALGNLTFEVDEMKISFPTIGQAEAKADGNSYNSSNRGTTRIDGVDYTTFTFETQDADGITKQDTYLIPSEYFNLLTCSKLPDDWAIKQQYPNDLENMKNVTKSVINSLRSSIYSVWDPNNTAFKPTSSSDYGYNEYEAYKTASIALAKQIFGDGVSISDSDYAKLDDIEECFNGSLAGKFTGNKKNDFTKIYDAYLLDCVMNTYGEPKYAWIDTTKPIQLPVGENQDTTTSYNQNADAKAQWYENLFERIQRGGYKVLQDGLASSSEWIQFAFESGIITMEQVDANKNWQPLIYSNCSDITEQTNDAAIAKAEAEYKSAMNKIENKDKRYDLELKNIDTEHNSLQVEYDSIKTAIDKNIERTFKLYS